MATYTVTDGYALRKLCINQNWFTSGDSVQYEKLFYANENGFTIKEIATIIWICSSDDWNKQDILSILKKERKKYLTQLDEAN